MKHIGANLATSAALAVGLVLASVGTAAAQRPVHPAMPATHAPSEHPASGSAAAAGDKTTFNGLAKKLDTTPEALQSAYEAAKAANPKLTRGQFVAANVLARNLGTKDPAITTDAILQGLKSGKSIGQTLQNLGLSKAEATEAERTADKEAKDATH